MPGEGDRRRKSPHLYDILIVPVGELGKTRRIRADRLKLGLLVLLFFLVSVGITLAVLIYTPLAIYVPIPNPTLEEKYGREIVETQQRLNTLVEDVQLLKDYNQQLRKALGETGAKDSTETGSGPPSVVVEGRPPAQQTDTDAAGAPVAAAQQGSGDEDVLDQMPSGDGEGIQSAGTHAAFPLITPVEGFVTQGFDPSRRHYGIDFAGKLGSTVYAAADGRVVFSGWTYEDGNLLIISHGGGYLTLYKHNHALLKNAPAIVKRGEPIALLGSSGKTSLGPHLHFEVLKDGVPQDPNMYLLTPSQVP